MKVEFSTGEDGAGLAVYTTDKHERGGVKHWRRIRVARYLTRTPMLRREVAEYRILVTEHGDDGFYDLLADGGVSTFRAALDVLGRALGDAIRDGFASKTDMERIPVV